MRIACVGDSITWGFFILHRRRDCYPAQLQRLLGEGVSVGNFGINGHTLQESGDRPYVLSKPYRESGEFGADFVLIMLGTNDSRPGNWNGVPRFLEDYRRLVAHYRELPEAPRIFVMTPPTVYGRGRADRVMYGMDAAAIDEMSVAIRELARDERLGLIDVHVATSGHPEAFRLDGVHPGAAGAALIARAARDALAPELASCPGDRSMCTDYLIQLAEPEHLDQLPEIEREAATRFGDSLPDSVLSHLTPREDLTTAQKAGLLWVALEPAGAPVGFAVATSCARRVHIEELDVLPAYGRKGIGSALIRAVEGFALNSGFVEITLMTFRDVAWNAPFYAHVGFEVIPEQELGEDLARRLSEEAALGLERSRRVAMRKSLNRPGGA